MLSYSYSIIETWIRCTPKGLAYGISFLTPLVWVGPRTVLNLFACGKVQTDHYCI